MAYLAHNATIRALCRILTCAILQMRFTMIPQRQDLPLIMLAYQMVIRWFCSIMMVQLQMLLNGEHPLQQALAMLLMEDLQGMQTMLLPAQ